MSMAACAATAPAVASADGLSGSTSPQDALSQARTALGKVSNLAVSGTESEKDGSSMKLSGTFTSSGPADIVIREGKATAHLIALPKAVYIRGNLAYWKATVGKKDGSIASRLAGKWIKESAKAGADATSGLGDLSPKHIGSCLDSHVGTLTNKGEKTVGGRKVIVLADAGDKPGTAPGELWLDEATALPVREVQTGPAKAGGTKDATCDGDDWPSTTTKSDLSLSKFGKAPKVVAPKGAVSPQKAAGGSGGSGGDGGSTPV